MTPFLEHQIYFR